jgi:single-strand DNA-binding protein
MRTTVTVEGNLADDPQVRFTPSGKQVTELTVLVNERHLNGDGEWVEGEATRHVVKAFKTLAENIVESLSKGDRVFVHGTVTTEAWTDKDTGGKRTAQRVLAEVVGPSLRWATTGSPRPPTPTPTPTRHPSRRSDQRPGEGARRDPRVECPPPLVASWHQFRLGSRRRSWCEITSNSVVRVDRRGRWADSRSLKSTQVRFASQLS